MGLWSWVKSLFAAGKAKTESSVDKPLISLVWLLSNERYLDQQVLANIIQRAWGVDLANADPDAKEFVVGFSPTFIVQCQERHFLVHNFPTTYVQDVEAVAESIQELRLRKAFREHKAWLAVDLLFAQEGEDVSAAYPYIGKLMAELADTDCLAIYSPATRQMLPFDESLEAALRGPDVLGVFKSLVHVPVVQVADDDPQMLAAVAEARRRWPEFVAVFERRQPGQMFTVKAPVTDGRNTEFIWASVTAVEGEQILGTLENEPVDLKNLYYGSRVRIKCADLNDWIVSDGKSILAGGFTIKVIQNLHGDWAGPRGTSS